MNQPVKGKNTEKSCLSGRQARVLVAPLDWGLGHATRCIPLIRELLEQGCGVWLAGEGAQERLLKEEFPQLPFLQLDGYRIRYSRSATGMLLSMFRQTPRILRAIGKENKWLKEMVKTHAFDTVISDNRFGLYHDSVPCIFITHQLAIKSPLGTWSERILRQRNYRFINRFSTCWVPDGEGENNWAGDLSHPLKKPSVPVQYLGLLSRFDASPPSPISEKIRKGHILIILSGPEPQRSMLEDQIIKEISRYNGTATILRGLPGKSSLIPSTNMIHFYNHLPSDELRKEIEQAEWVISRCGYSTVMDLATLQKKSILVPTPGQTEQEYLGKYLLQKKMAYCIPQKKFFLEEALSEARQFSYHLPEVNTTNTLQQVVSNWISKLAAE